MEFSESPPQQPEQVSKHEQRAAEKAGHEKIVQETRDQRLRERRTTNIVLAVILLIIISSFGYWTFTYYRAAPEYGQNVHWHTQLIMSVCGKSADLPRISAGASHLGLASLHTHNDNIIHIEGYVSSAQEITLGKFMDAVGVIFSETEFFVKKNGDDCDGKPGRVKMLVNGEPSTFYRDYVAKDGDTVTLLFEP